MHDQFCSYQIIIFIGDFRFGGAEVVGVNQASICLIVYMYV